MFMTGGDRYGGETGFLGCMRNLLVQGFSVTEIAEESNIGNVVNGSCELQDRFVVFFTFLLQQACVGPGAIICSRPNPFPGHMS